MHALEILNHLRSTLKFTLNDAALRKTRYIPPSSVNPSTEAAHRLALVIAGESKLQNHGETKNVGPR
jgi:hypothetical protein